MAAVTNQQLLDACNAAILNVMAGVQSVTQPDGSVVQYPDLKTLMANKAELQALADQEGGAGGFVQMGGSELTGI